VSAGNSFHGEEKRNLSLTTHRTSLYWGVLVKRIAPSFKGRAVILVGLLDPWKWGLQFVPKLLNQLPIYTA